MAAQAGWDSVLLLTWLSFGTVPCDGESLPDAELITLAGACQLAKGPWRWMLWKQRAFGSAGSPPNMGRVLSSQAHFFLERW